MIQKEQLQSKTNQLQTSRKAHTDPQTHKPYVCGAGAEMKASPACLASTL